jgi:hypothetical protein
MIRLVQVSGRGLHYFCFCLLHFSLTICTCECLLTWQIFGPVLTVICRYFLVGNLAKTEEEVIRIASLLRGTESAAQAGSVSGETREWRVMCANYALVWSQQHRCHKPGGG